MTETRHTRRYHALLWAVLCLAPLGVQAQAPFEAAYEVRIDGKPRLETRMRLASAGDHWILESSSEGTSGLARFLNVGSEEQSTLAWVEDHFEPLTFRHHSKVAGVDQRWEAEFGRTAGQVLTRTEDGEHRLDASPATVDPLSLTLTLSRLLATGASDFEVKVVDEDTIDTHRYAIRSSGHINTALGCLDTIELERIRENSSRYSTGWYARELNYLPVRVRHGKRGGRDFDMRIRQLEIDGNPVFFETACPD